MNAEISHLEAHIAVNEACWQQYASVNGVDTSTYHPNWPQQLTGPMVLHSTLVGPVVLFPPHLQDEPQGGDRLIITLPHPKTKSMVDGITEYTIHGDGVLRQTRWTDYKQYSRQRFWLPRTFPNEMYSPDTGREVPADRARFLRQVIINAIPQHAEPL